MGKIIVFLIVLSIGFAIVSGGKVWNFSTGGYKAFKLIFSIAVALLFPEVVFATFWGGPRIHSVSRFWLTEIAVIYILIPVIFIGFQMMLYGFFRKNDEG